MDLQIYRLLEEDYTYDMFRSEMYHMRKNHSDKDFVFILIKYNFVEVFWKKEWYYKAFYTLALLDYLSDKHNAPYFEKYNNYRTQKLKEIVYPSGIEIWDRLNPNNNEKEIAIQKCKNDEYGKYFLKYNIIELED